MRIPWTSIRVRKGPKRQWRKVAYVELVGMLGVLYLVNLGVMFSSPRHMKIVWVLSALALLPSIRNAVTTFRQEQRTRRRFRRIRHRIKELEQAALTPAARDPTNAASQP
ncbi:MAG: hypothetical protein IT441_10500 [Phycisphaeraceae bacterium]|nr:hypothetical protein [Phycisphaeraceae bacterium]